MQRYIALFFVIGLIVISCKSTKYEKEITNLNNLYDSLNKKEIALKNIDYVKTEAYFLETQNNLNFIQNNFKDSMEHEMANFLSDYYAILEPLEMFNEKRSELLEELDYSKEQISNLLHDINNNSLSATVIEKSYTTEVEASNETINSVNAMVEMGEKVISEFEQRNNRVKQIIAQLKAK